MAGLAASMNTSEVAMLLYGLWTHVGDAVVHLVTGPGPGARSELAMCTFDDEYAKSVSPLLWGQFGVRNVGFSHSHAGMKLDSASATDHGQSKSFAVLNGFNMLVQIIMTVSTDITQDRCYGWWRFGRGYRESRRRVHVHPYVFDVAENRFVPCRISILPYPSPLRQAVLAAGILNETDLLHHVLSFPLEQIDLPRFERAVIVSDQETGPLRGICQQISALPASMQEGLEIWENESAVTVAVQLDESRAAQVDVSRTAPHDVRAVRLICPGADGPVDVTDRIFAAGGFATLIGAVETLSSLSAGQAVANVSSRELTESDMKKQKRRSKRKRNKAGGAVETLSSLSTGHAMAEMSSRDLTEGDREKRKRRSKRKRKKAGGAVEQLSSILAGQAMEGVSSRHLTDSDRKKRKRGPKPTRKKRGRRQGERVEAEQQQKITHRQRARQEEEFPLRKKRLKARRRRSVRHQAAVERSSGTPSDSGCTTEPEAYGRRCDGEAHDDLVEGANESQDNDN
jgi:hypothetical protein